MERVFQERIHLDLHHDALTLNQLKYLQVYYLDYELRRIARKVLDHLVAHKGIDLLIRDGIYLTSAARVGNLQLLILLLQVPSMNSAAGFNSAITWASEYGHLGDDSLQRNDMR